MEIGDRVRRAAAAFRENDVEASIRVALRLWWMSRLRGRRFAALVHEAYDVTQVRISLGAVERSDAGRREAMPYFLAVLRDLMIQDGRTRCRGGAGSVRISARNSPRQARDDTNSRRH